MSRNDEAIAEARGTGHRNSLALPLFFGATLRQLIGDRGTVRAMVDELAALAQEEGFRFWFAGATILRGWAVAEGGDIDHGMRMMESGIAEWQATGAEYMLPYFSVLLAQNRMRAVGANDVGWLLDSAIARIERSRERWFESEVHRVAGAARLHCNVGDQIGAERCFKRALGVAGEQNARLWELRAATDLASLWLDLGKERDAHDLLAPLCASFADASPVPDLVRAADVLRSVEAAS